MEEFNLEYKKDFTWMKILKVKQQRLKWGGNFSVISNELEYGDQFYVIICDN